MMVQDIFELINKEKNRQNNTIELIASENFVSKNILKAQGSVLLTSMQKVFHIKGITADVK